MSNDGMTVLFWLFIGVLGMFVGSLVGVYLDNGSISPDCWIGLAIVWGLPICGCCIGDVDV